MSIKLMTMAWDLPLPPGEKLLLLALADYSNDNGDCFPGQISLARRCSVSDRAIRKQINNLVQRGYLEVKRRSRGRGEGRKSNQYRLILQPEQSSGCKLQPELEDITTGTSRHYNRNPGSY